MGFNSGFKELITLQDVKYK